MSDRHRTQICTWADERTFHRAKADEATDRLRLAVRDAVHHGMSESEAARLANVTRMTVRKWLGK